LKYLGRVTWVANQPLVRLAAASASAWITDGWRAVIDPLHLPSEAASGASGWLDK